ncbi:hypothetical protein TNCV_1373821 [Trichonephila clavipes]|nr:hypothetical protein TNCV_1373821 [Trichonephila clavipes]
MEKRPRGSSPLRWIDCVEKDLNVLKVKNSKTIAKRVQFGEKEKTEKKRKKKKDIKIFHRKDRRIGVEDYWLKAVLSPAEM